MTVPKGVREEVRESLWSEADRLDWAHLTPNAKARFYDNWTRDPAYGGRLSRYVNADQVRTYLKNSIMGGYGRARLSDDAKPLRVLGIADDAPIIERYEKPHGLLLADGRVIAWGVASSWRSILLSLHERAYGHGAVRPFGAVLFRGIGRYREARVREMITAAAEKLGIEEVVWLEA